MPLCDVVWWCEMVLLPWCPVLGWSVWQGLDWSLIKQEAPSMNGRSIVLISQPHPSLFYDSWLLHIWWSFWTIYWMINISIYIHKVNHLHSWIVAITYTMEYTILTLNSSQSFYYTIGNAQSHLHGRATTPEAEAQEAPAKMEVSALWKVQLGSRDLGLAPRWVT